jgi:hypothetical protein
MQLQVYSYGGALGARKTEQSIYMFREHFGKKCIVTNKNVNLAKMDLILSICPRTLALSNNAASGPQTGLKSLSQQARWKNSFFITLSHQRLAINASALACCNT